MTEFFNTLASHPNAANIAFALALISAISHSIFGALQKDKNDPFLVRAAIDFWFIMLWLPIGLFFMPWPTAYEWLLIAGLFPIHTAYKTALAMAYRNGDYSFIYPIARGSSPFFTALIGFAIFGDALHGWQWLGIVIISLAIMAMAIEAAKRNNLDPKMLKAATWFALLTGALITTYSLYDTFGVRESRSPMIFLTWFYVIDGWIFPLVAYIKRDSFRPVNGYRPLAWKGFYTSLFGILSFTAIFIASDIGRIGEVFAIRETSVVFAALIGYFFLREKVSPLRFALIGLIALGAILIKVGSIT